MRPSLKQCNPAPAISTEQALKDCVENFQTFFETLDDLIFVASLDGRILFSNRAASEKLGYAREEFRAMHLIDLHPAEMRAEAQEILGAMFRKERETCPLPLKKRSGEHLHVETRVWIGKWDRKDCLFGLCKDATENWRATAVQNELLDRLLKIAGRVPGVIYQFRLRPDGTSCFPFASEAIRQIYRVSPEDVREDASKVFANLHPDDRDGVVASIQKSARELAPWQYEYRVKFDDGTIRMLYGNAVPQREDDGSVLWHGFITDITERKQADIALKEFAAYTRSLIEASLDPLVTINSEGIITDVNEASILATGKGREQLVGSDFSDCFTEPANARAGYRKTFTDGLVRDYPLTLRHTSGRTIDVLYNASVYRDEQGVVLGIFAAARDITERKREERVVLDNMARAEELTRLKSRFVSMASHELRTPLSNITIACELLKNFGDAMPVERSRSILDGLMTGMESMVRTLDDLLVAGRIEEGKMPFTPAGFCLGDFLGRCCMAAQPDRKLPARIDIVLQNLEIRVVADEHLLGRILINLLENALKYSPDDSRVELKADAAADCLTLSVLDRGIGVPEADRKFLFDAFSRASNAADKPGSGLGLFIAQKCAEAHRGRMHYMPRPDGSVFSVTVPLNPAGYPNRIP